MRMEHKHIEFEGSTISYSVSGSGPAVMLIHGFGEDHRIWKNQAAALSSRYTVILPDLPGSGRSEMTDNPEAGMETYADCLYDILKNEQIEKCVLLGHSMGGYVTLAMAEKYPELIIGFGLIHSTAFSDNEEKKEVRSKGIRFIRSFGPKEFLKNSIPGLFHDPLKNKKEIDELIMQAGDFSAEALCEYYRAMMERPDRRHVISGIRVPFLLIAGVFDTAVPLQQSLQQAWLAENTEFHILRSSGHMGMIEESEKCSSIFGSFLANIYPER